MKYMKMLGLLAIAAAALMAFAGTASAKVTSPAGTLYNSDIHATSTNTTLHGSVTIECKKSTVSGKPTVAGGTTGAISTLTFEECLPDTVTVVKKGHITINNATNQVTSTGAEVTVVVHRTVLGFPVTSHCIYATNNTPVGTLVEGHKPVLNIGSSSIPQVTTDHECGSTAVWTGTYSVTTPTELIVD